MGRVIQLRARVPCRSRQQQQVQQQQLEAYTQHYSGTACSVGASELWAWQCEAWGDCQQ